MIVEQTQNPPESIDPGLPSEGASNVETMANVTDTQGADQGTVEHPGVPSEPDASAEGDLKDEPDSTSDAAGTGDDKISEDAQGDQGDQDIVDKQDAEKASAQPAENTGQDASAQDPSVKAEEDLKQEVEPKKEELSPAAQFLMDVKVNGTDIQKKAISVMEHFSSVLVARVPIKPAYANAAQRALTDYMLSLLQMEYADFKQGWSTLLVYFFEHHDNSSILTYSSVSEQNMLRYLNYWKDVEKARAFSVLVALLRMTRDPASRKTASKNLNFDATIAGLISERGIDNLKKFYM